MEFDPSVYAELSKHSYRPKGTPPPKGWEVLSFSEKVEPISQAGRGLHTLATDDLLPPTEIRVQHSGYQGVAYRHQETGCIVIAHAGTDLANLRDLTAVYNLVGDITLSAFRVVPAAHYFAEQFTSEVQKKYGLDFARIEHTGQSLGGVHAQLLGVKYLQSQVVTFESPGVRELLPVNLRNKDYPNVTNYVMPENPINSTHTRVGQTIVLQYHPDDVVEIRKLSSPISRILKRHSIDTCIAALRTGFGQTYIQASPGAILPAAPKVRNEPKPSESATQAQTAKSVEPVSQAKPGIRFPPRDLTWTPVVFQPQPTQPTSQTSTSANLTLSNNSGQMQYQVQGSVDTSRSLASNVGGLAVVGIVAASMGVNYIKYLLMEKKQRVLVDVNAFFPEFYRVMKLKTLGWWDWFCSRELQAKQDEHCTEFTNKLRKAIKANPHDEERNYIFRAMIYTLENAHKEEIKAALDQWLGPMRTPSLNSAKIQSSLEIYERYRQELVRNFNVEIQKDKIGEADYWLRKLAEFFPDSQESLNAAAVLEEQRGNVSPARSLYQRVLDRANKKLIQFTALTGISSIDQEDLRRLICEQTDVIARLAEKVTMSNLPRAQL